MFLPAIHIKAMRAFFSEDLLFHIKANIMDVSAFILHSECIVLSL